MKGRIMNILILSIIFLALTAATTGCIEERGVSAEEQPVQPPKQSSDGDQPEYTAAGGMDLILEQLENEGYNISEIRTAIGNGDRETARILMEQYMENAPDI